MGVFNQDLVIVLFGFLKGLIGLDQMREWLAANVWKLTESPSPLDRMIVGELEIALAEYNRGDRDEPYLRGHVQLLLHLPNPMLPPRLSEMESILALSWGQRNTVFRGY